MKALFLWLLSEQVYFLLLYFMCMYINAYIIKFGFFYTKDTQFVCQ